MENNKTQFTNIYHSGSKTYDLNNLENFLSKIVTKIEEGTEDIGRENQDIISDWLKDFKQKKLDTDTNSNQITISYNESIYEDNMTLHSDMGPFYENLKILTDASTSPHYKDSAFDSISKNIKNFNFSQKDENYVISLLEENEWEKINAAVLILSEILEKEINSFRMDKIIESIEKNFKRLINQQEYRLRSNLSKLFKFSSVELIKSKNFDLIKKWLDGLFSDIFTNYDSSNDTNNHPTLETSKNILIEIFNEIRNYSLTLDENSLFKENFLSSFLNTPIKILTENLSNENKGIRASSYEILRSLAFFFFKDSDVKNLEFSEILKKLSNGLTDFYPQIRYSACIFLIEYARYKGKEFFLENQFFFEKILPIICLNRYIPVEGVKNSSLEIWKFLVETNGINIIKENFEKYLILYLSEMNTKSHVAREAACRCLQEIIMKVYEEKMHQEIMETHLSKILDSMERCIKDPCWNVRESSLYSAGYVFNILHRIFVSNMLLDGNLICDENWTKFENFAELIRLHLFDNIYEVRAASAFAIRIILSLIEKPQLEKIQSMKDSLDFLNTVKFHLNLLSNSEDLKASHIKFNHEIRLKIENQREKIRQSEKCCQGENKCKESQLSSKDCSHFNNIPDLGIIREIDLWEYVDGIIQLSKEFSEDSVARTKTEIKFETVIMNIIDYLCKNYTNTQNLSKKTLWIALNTAFEKVNKAEVDFYFEYIKNIVFREIKENVNNLSVFEAENFLITILKLKGKRYITNKLKSLNLTNDSELCKRIEGLLNN